MSIDGRPSTSRAPWGPPVLDEAFSTLEPDAVVLVVVVTPLWYGQRIEHRRPHLDRGRPDAARRGSGQHSDVIEANLDTRPSTSSGRHRSRSRRSASYVIEQVGRPAICTGSSAARSHA
jgi:hypothetical protein